MSSQPIADEEYMTKCHNTMRLKYGESVYILVTQKADPAIYPNGAWFDEYLNKPLKVAGIDEDNKPGLYVLPGGKIIPFSYAELLSWTPPAFGYEELVILVEEMYSTKRLPSQQEILVLLRPAFPKLPDNVELIISQFSPFIFTDGTLLWLEEHRHQVGDYEVIFVAGVHEMREGKFCVVTLDSGKRSCITLMKHTVT